MNQRPRILHVINGLGDGGAESVLYRLCANDPRFQHVVVSLLGEGRYAALLRAGGVPVHTLEMSSLRGGLLAPVRLWRLLRQLRPDVVQTWMYHADLLGGLLARLARRGRVCWNLRHAELDSARSSRASRWSGRACARLSRWLPRAIICCGQRAAEAHAAMGYERARMRVIPNGYDLDRLRPDPAARQRLRAELGLSPGQVALGTIANFKPDKDHDTLLAALARLLPAHPQAIALLAGRDITPENPALAALLQRHGLAGRVRLLGPRADVPALMNALDLHVLSSRSEGFPNVLAEAMACGTPCVSTNAGDAALIVGETGWIVPPGDPARLASAIAEALAEALAGPAATRSGQHHWTQRRQAVRQRIEQHFSLAAMRDAYGQLWQQLNAGAAA